MSIGIYVSVSKNIVYLPRERPTDLEHFCKRKKFITSLTATKSNNENKAFKHLCSKKCLSWQFLTLYKVLSILGETVFIKLTTFRISGFNFIDA
jgi:hypothetical protein